MKILILGASGMAGHTIVLYFKEQKIDVTAFTRKPFAYCSNIVGNVFETEAFTRVLSEGNYDVIINCIGILNDYAEKRPSQAIYLNSFLPHLIADTIKNTKTKLIQMSTDCVFSGLTGNYIETSLKDGETFYDRSKALGEVVDSNNLTFRNSIIGPDINKDGIGLFNWFMKQHNSINGYSKAIWTGVTTLTLAKAMESAIKQNLSGLYNLVNNTTISKYELLCLFNKYFKDSKLAIFATDAVQVNKSLVNTRTDFSFVVPSYEQMLVEMKEWIFAHKSLYPHYF